MITDVSLNMKRKYTERLRSVPRVTQPIRGIVMK